MKGGDMKKRQHSSAIVLTILKKKLMSWTLFSRWFY